MPTKDRPLKLSHIGTRKPTLRSSSRKVFQGTVARYVGPGHPPAGFLNPWNSDPEWVLYWILWKILHEVGDVRKPPFIGGEHFGYQSVLDGGRSSLGGQIVDFVVYMPGQDTGLFLTGDRYHVEGGSIQHAIDASRLEAAARYMKVLPVYEQEILPEPTGEAGCRNVVELLGGRRSLNPVTSGSYRATRPKRLFGGTNA